MSTSEPTVRWVVETRLTTAEWVFGLVAASYLLLLHLIWWWGTAYDHPFPTWSAMAPFLVSTMLGVGSVGAAVLAAARMIEVLRRGVAVALVVGGSAFSAILVANVLLIGFVTLYYTPDVGLATVNRHALAQRHHPPDPAECEAAMDVVDRTFRLVPEVEWAGMVLPFGIVFAIGAGFGGLCHLQQVQRRRRAAEGWDPNDDLHQDLV